MKHRREETTLGALKIALNNLHGAGYGDDTPVNATLTVLRRGIYRSKTRFMPGFILKTKPDQRFMIETGIGEFCIRTRGRYYQPWFAIEIHLIGYRKEGYRDRWAFIQFGRRTLWLKRT